MICIVCPYGFLFPNAEKWTLVCSPVTTSTPRFGVMAPHISALVFTATYCAFACLPPAHSSNSTRIKPGMILRHIFIFLPIFNNIV